MDIFLYIAFYKYVQMLHRTFFFFKFQSKHISGSYFITNLLYIFFIYNLVILF